MDVVFYDYDDLDNKSSGNVCDQEDEEEFQFGLMLDENIITISLERYKVCRT